MTGYRVQIVLNGIRLLSELFLCKYRYLAIQNFNHVDETVHMLIFLD